MTKRWSSTASLDGQTKRQASKRTRREMAQETDQLSAADLDQVIDDLVQPVSDIAAMKPTNAWPAEIRTLIGTARTVAKKYGFGFVCVKGPGG